MPAKPPESMNRAPASHARESQRTLLALTPALPAPAAFWFGPAERPLFGWYHATTATPRAVVVLCNPLGHEALVLHRTYRRLAQHLAANGFATLRFDYDGTGDSAGNDAESGRVQAWLASIQLAVAEASRLSGSHDVILLGTRMGALLATTHAEQFPVAGLVLIAPPRTGKAWLREARALQAIKDSLLPQVEGVEPEQGIAGFLLSDSTRTDLSQLYFSKVARAPARHVLVVARDDLPGGEVELVQVLNDLGAKAELCLAPGHAASMPEDPFKAVVPLQLFDALTRWLDGTFPVPLPRLDEEAPPSSSAGANRFAFKSSILTDATTRERLVDVDGLFGIVTEPVEPSARTKTAIVLLNIGANYRVGSNRMYVHMARVWAAQGFQVLRMDFSGMGDSRLGSSGKENDVYAQRFMAEARSAVDHLKDRGATRVVLMGLCSGAYIAYHTATADPRVSGVVLVNPLTFHWTEGDSLEVRMRESFGTTEQYRRRLFKYDTWQRIFRGKVGVGAISTELARRVARRASSEVKSVLAKVTGQIAEATDIERGFKRISMRGASSLVILGKEDGSRDVIEGHLGRDAGAMKNVNGFHMEVWDGADHTFTALWAQRKLTQLIGQYLIDQHAGE